MLSNSQNTREIDVRSNGGITVTLSGVFSADNVCQYAVVHVDSPTEEFTLSEIPLDKAADVYHHPFIYASRVLASGRLAA